MQFDPSQVEETLEAFTILRKKSKGFQGNDFGVWQVGRIVNRHVGGELTTPVIVNPELYRG
jgi:hypothetical protein